MDYALSNNELWELESCMRQFGLMEDLFALIKSGQQPLDIDGLYFFFRAQKAALASIHKAAQERAEAQTVLDHEQVAMKHFDWMHALRIARGDALHTPNGSVQRITAKLENAAQIDDSMQFVLDEWLVILGAAQAPAPAAPKAPRAPAKPRKRERLTANA